MGMVGVAHGPDPGRCIWRVIQNREHGGYHFLWLLKPGGKNRTMNYTLKSLSAQLL